MERTTEDQPFCLVHMHPDDPQRGGHNSTPLEIATKPSKSGDSQATMTVTVPQDSNKCKVQSNEGAPHAKRQRRAGKPKSD